MSIQDAMMENYNYWRDSRVQESMFKPVWKIVEEGQHSAIVAIDDSWVEDCLADHLFDPELSEEEKELPDEERNALISKRWDEFSEKTKKRFVYHERSDSKYTLEVPVKYEACGTCGGSGKVVDPRIDASGLSREDFDEDPIFAQNYFSGRYDVTCPRCHGRRVESHPQFPEWLDKAIQNRDEGIWEDISERCAEMAMGA